MLADPARRTLETRPARRVCCAAKPYRSRAAVRGCAVLATDSRDMTLRCRLFYSRTVVTAAMPCLRSTRSLTLRDVPLRLYGSLRAVKVLRAALWSTIDCACSAAGPARMASRWSNHRRKVFETGRDRKVKTGDCHADQQQGNSTRAYKTGNSKR